MHAAVFFDRDGTLIRAYDRRDEPPHMKITAPLSLRELIFERGARRVFPLLRDAGFLRVMITNQPDVAHGFLDERMWQIIQDRVTAALPFNGVYMCRHRTEDECPFKKPSPLMLRMAADNLGIDLTRSYMVGDTVSDIEAGRAAGCRTILIRRPYNTDTQADIVVPDLCAVPDAIFSDRAEREKRS